MGGLRRFKEAVFIPFFPFQREGSRRKRVTYRYCFGGGDERNLEMDGKWKRSEEKQ